MTRGRIDVGRMMTDVARRGAGGTVLFIGTVRDHSEFGEVDMIDYDVYEPMAEKQLRQIEEDVLASWPESRVRLLHRVGRLKVGEVSVAVVVSAPHRAEAFEASRYAIERIKRDVPIWKRERLADGTSRWVQGKRIEARKPKSRTRQ